MAEKKLFLDYGGLICDYEFNKDTLFRAHHLVLDHINSNGDKITLDQLAQAHDSAIKDYLTARNKDSSEWKMNKIMGLMLSNLNLNGSVSISKINHLYKLNDHDIAPYPSTSKVLNELSKTRELNIISNLPHDSLIYELREFNLLELFKTITISYQVGFRKPHPKIYQEALKRANVTPSESIFISHDNEEVKGAEKLGIESLLVKSIKELIGVL